MSATRPLGGDRNLFLEGEGERLLLSADDEELGEEEKVFDDDDGGGGGGDREVERRGEWRLGGDLERDLDRDLFEDLSASSSS